MALSAEDFASGEREDRDAAHYPRALAGFDYRWMEYPPALCGRDVRHRRDASLMTFRGHSVLQTLIRCYFSPAGSTGQRYIYSGSRDGDVVVWDAATGEVAARLGGEDGSLPSCGHSDTVRDCSWHPTEPQMATVSWDGSVRLWGLPKERGWVNVPKGEAAAGQAAPDADPSPRPAHGHSRGALSGFFGGLLSQLRRS